MIPELKPCEVDQLMRFYNVSTLTELVAALSRHIEKLQEKVPDPPWERAQSPKVRA